MEIQTEDLFNELGINELQLPEHLLELMKQLSPRQLRYALHYLVHTNKCDALRFAGYAEGTINAFIDRLVVAKPEVRSFINACNEWFTSLGILDAFEIRKKYTQVVEGEIHEFTAIQMEALKQLATLQGLNLKNPEEPVSSIEITHRIVSVSKDEVRPEIESPDLRTLVDAPPNQLHLATPPTRNILL